MAPRAGRFDPFVVPPVYHADAAAVPDESRRREEIPAQVTWLAGDVAGIYTDMGRAR